MENQEAKTLGIISLVTGLIGFFAFGLVFGAISAVTGLLAWRQSTVAKIGAIIGIVDFMVVILYLMTL